MFYDVSTAKSLKLSIQKVPQSTVELPTVEKKRVVNKLFPNSELFSKWGDELSEDEQK